MVISKFTGMDRDEKLKKLREYRKTVHNRLAQPTGKGDQTQPSADKGATLALPETFSKFLADEANK